MTTANHQLAATGKPMPAPVAMVPAKVSFAAGLISLLLITALHFIKSDLSPAAHMLSEYSIGENGWIMQLAFYAWSLSCFSLAISIRKQVTTGAGKFGIVLLYVTGFALIIGGYFVIDSPYADPPVMTSHGQLHGLSAMIGLPSQAIAALLISYSLRKNSHWRFAGKPIITLANLTWISLLLMFAATFLMMSLSQGKFTGDTGIGWFNRLLVLVCCSWLMVVAKKAQQVK